jgi:hypothetical protein
VSTLLTRLEVTKLADELGTAEEPLAFLAEATVEDLRALRALITHARFARHERRLARLAGLTKLAPAALAARIAEHALGAEVSARVATLIDPADAARLTKHLGPEFLTDVSVSLDPERSAAVITSLPESLIVQVGKRLMARGEHLTLARFVSLYSVEVALQVLDGVSGDDLLTMGMFAEDHASLDAIVAWLPDDRVVSVIEAAESSGREEDTIAMLSFLSGPTRARFLAAIAALPTTDRKRFTKLATDLGYGELLG